MTDRCVDVDEWRTNSSKSLEDLWNEIVEQDCTIVDLQITRFVEVVRILILDGSRILIEDSQQFSDGRIRRRGTCPSEKLLAEESYLEAAIRCVREEIGVPSDRVSLLESSHRESIELKPSLSYPGVLTLYRLHTVQAHVTGLPGNDFSCENTSTADPIVRHHWIWKSVDGISPIHQ